MYKIQTFVDDKDGDRFYNMRKNLSWAAICGIIGNSAESDVIRANITRQSDDVLVMRYDKDGFDL